MNKEQAIKILIQAAEVAQTKGAFNLNDASVIANAVNVLNSPTPAGHPNQEVPVVLPKPIKPTVKGNK